MIKLGGLAGPVVVRLRGARPFTPVVTQRPSAKRAIVPKEMPLETSGRDVPGGVESLIA
jgi:hypothetical protein